MFHGGSMARLAAKPGVQPHSLLILIGIANVVSKMASPIEVIITAGRNGCHGTFSYHYDDRALDVRTHNFASTHEKQLFAADLRKELGPGYDVILESLGLDNEHIHIEH